MPEFILSTLSSILLVPFTNHREKERGVVVDHAVRENRGEEMFQTTGLNGAKMPKARRV